MNMWLSAFAGLCFGSAILLATMQFIDKSETNKKETVTMTEQTPTPTDFEANAKKIQQASKANAAWRDGHYAGFEGRKRKEYHTPKLQETFDRGYAEGQEDRLQSLKSRGVID